MGAGGDSNSHRHHHHHHHHHDENGKVLPSTVSPFNCATAMSGGKGGAGQLSKFHLFAVMVLMSLGSTLLLTGTMGVVGGGNASMSITTDDADAGRRSLLCSDVPGSPDCAPPGIISHQHHHNHQGAATEDAGSGMRRLFSIGGNTFYISRGRGSSTPCGGNSDDNQLSSSSSSSSRLGRGGGAAAAPSFGSRRVIIGMFSGRRRNLRMVAQYMSVLVHRGLVSELHLWDFSARRGVHGGMSRKERQQHKENARKDVKTMKQIQELYPFVKYMDPDQEPEHKEGDQWYEYYRHYARGADTTYNHSVVIKVDDDVIYWDVDAFEGFIKHRVDNPEYLAMFPGIINNGVSAHYQQQRGLLPPADSTMGEFPYDVFYGKLVDSGVVASRLHYHFIQHREEMIQRARSLKSPIVEQPIGDRISINCFAVLSEDLADFFGFLNKDKCSKKGDDEHCATVEAPKALDRPLAFDLSLTVVHMSFENQRKCLDIDEIYPFYEKEAERIVSREASTRSSIGGKRSGSSGGGPLRTALIRRDQEISIE